MPELHPTIPDHQWQPLNVQDALDIFHDAPFDWYVAGGYAVEQFWASPRATSTAIWISVSSVTSSWLRNTLNYLYSNGHDWLAQLSAYPKSGVILE